MDAMIAGDAFQANDEIYKDMKGNFVVRFSNKFLQYIQAQKKAGYQLQPTGKMNMIVYWKVEEGKEVRVVLPEVFSVNQR